MQVIEPQTSELSGAVFDGDGDAFVGFYLWQQVESRVFPPVDLALQQRGGGRGWIRDKVPDDSIDVGDLWSGVEAGDAVLTRDVRFVFGEYDAGAGDALTGDEFEGAAADRLGDLLHGVGLRQAHGHDGTIDLREG